MNFGLSEEQQMIVDTTRAFVENELFPHEAEVERTGILREDLRKEISRKAVEAGLYAANMPEEVGGAGLDLLFGGHASAASDAGDGATDHFVFTSLSDSSYARPDAISGFELGIDKIDLSRLDDEFGGWGFSQRFVGDGGDFTAKGQARFVADEFGVAGYLEVNGDDDASTVEFRVWIEFSAGSTGTFSSGDIIWN